MKGYPRSSVHQHKSILPGSSGKIQVPRTWERRRRAVEYVDKAIAPLLKLDVDDLVITADHNLAHGDWSPDWFSVFLATKIDGRVIGK